MSGGHFDYKCFEISRFADELQHEIDTNEDKDDTGFAYDFSVETIEKLTTCCIIINLAGDLAKEVEWLYSGDSGEEGFTKVANKIMLKYASRLVTKEEK